MKKKFDCIVIGAGAGGLNVASFMNEAGFSVLLIEKTEASIGGDCLNHGCIPSKALIHVSERVHASDEARQFFSYPPTQSPVDIQKVMNYIRERQNIIREHHENKTYFEKKGIMVVIGTATFSGENTVMVNDVEYFGKKIVIATGSRPRQLSFSGSEQVPVYTSDTIWAVQKIPQHFVFVGGGPICLEIGQAFLRFGSRVSVVDMAPRILSRESEQVSAYVHDFLLQEGMDFYLQTQIEKWENGILYVRVQGMAYEIPCDAVFVGIGRDLNIDTLQLENAGIEVGQDKKIITNGYLQTTNKNVYVIGDALGQHMFTHAAELHARTIIKHFFNPFAPKLNTRSMSWVMYTDPEIAVFGLSEKELQESGKRYEVLETRFSHDDRAIVQNKNTGFARIFVSGGVIEGGVMVAKDAGELVQELILAQSLRLPLKSLFNKTYPYPTASRINKDIFAPYWKKKLTPFIKRILRVLY